MPYKDLEASRELIRANSRRNYAKNKEYYQKKTKKRRKMLYDWYREYKATLWCEQCGQDHPATLDFHHEDSDDKEFSISSMPARGISIENMKNEISKCMVLCANCHRIVHYEEKNKS